MGSVGKPVHDSSRVLASTLKRTVHNLGLRSIAHQKTEVRVRVRTDGGIRIAVNDKPHVLYNRRRSSITENPREETLPLPNTLVLFR